MRARDYSKPLQSSDCSISEQNDVISCSNSKKRKIRSEPDSNMNKNSNKDLFVSDSHSEELAQTITEIPLNTTNAADNLMSQGDSDNSSNKDKTQQEISSISIAENNDQTNQDWWKISCQAYCYICKTENAIDESTNKYECAECGEEQYVAQLCCADPSAKELFSVSVSENFVSCPICKSSKVRLPCCGKFQPSLQLDNNVYDCAECSKYSSNVYVSILIYCLLSQ